MGRGIPRSRHPSPHGHLAREIVGSRRAYVDPSSRAAPAAVTIGHPAPAVAAIAADRADGPRSVDVACLDVDGTAGPAAAGAQAGTAAARRTRLPIHEYGAIQGGRAGPQDDQSGAAVPSRSRVAGSPAASGQPGVARRVVGDTTVDGSGTASADAAMASAARARDPITRSPAARARTRALNGGARVTPTRSHDGGAGVQIEIARESDGDRPVKRENPARQDMHIAIGVGIRQQGDASRDVQSAGRVGGGDRGSQGRGEGGCLGRRGR